MCDTHIIDKTNAKKSLENCTGNNFCKISLLVKCWNALDDKLTRNILTKLCEVVQPDVGSREDNGGVFVF